MLVSNRTAYIYLFFTMTFWAGNAVTGRLFYEDLPPLQLAFWRWVIAGIIIYAVFRPPLMRDFPIMWAHKWPIFWIATFGIGAYNTMQYWALNYTTVSNAGLLQTTMPVVICLLEWLVYRTMINRLQMLGMVAATAGVLVVIGRGQLDVLLNLSFNIGSNIVSRADFN